MATETADLFNNDDRLTADLNAVRLLHLGCWRDYCAGSRLEPDPTQEELAAACASNGLPGVAGDNRIGVSP